MPPSAAMRRPAPSNNGGGGGGGGFIHSRGGSAFTGGSSAGGGGGGGGFSRPSSRGPSFRYQNLQQQQQQPQRHAYASSALRGGSDGGGEDELFDCDDLDRSGYDGRRQLRAANNAKEKKKKGNDKSVWRRVASSLNPFGLLFGGNRNEKAPSNNGVGPADAMAEKRRNRKGKRQQPQNGKTKKKRLHPAAVPLWAKARQRYFAGSFQCSVAATPRWYQALSLVAVLGFLVWEFVLLTDQRQLFGGDGAASAASAGGGRGWSSFVNTSSRQLDGSVSTTTTDFGTNIHAYVLSNRISILAGGSHLFVERDFVALLRALHFSLWTNYLWPPSYQRELDAMTLRERFGLALLAAALSGVAAAGVFFVRRTRAAAFGLLEASQNEQAAAAAEWLSAKRWELTMAAAEAEAKASSALGIGVGTPTTFVGLGGEQVTAMGTASPGSASANVFFHGGESPIPPALRGDGGGGFSSNTAAFGAQIRSNSRSTNSIGLGRRPLLHTNNNSILDGEVVEMGAGGDGGENINHPHGDRTDDEDTATDPARTEGGSSAFQQQQQWLAAAAATALASLPNVPQRLNLTGIFEWVPLIYPPPPPPGTEASNTVDPNASSRLGNAVPSVEAEAAARRRGEEEAARRLAAAHTATHHATDGFDDPLSPGTSGSAMPPEGLASSPSHQHSFGSSPSPSPSSAAAMGGGAGVGTTPLPPLQPHEKPTLQTSKGKYLNMYVAVIVVVETAVSLRLLLSRWMDVTAVIVDNDEGVAGGYNSNPSVTSGDGDEDEEGAGDGTTDLDLCYSSSFPKGEKGFLSGLASLDSVKKFVPATSSPVRTKGPNGVALGADIPILETVEPHVEETKWIGGAQPVNGKSTLSSAPFAAEDISKHRHTNRYPSKRGSNSDTNTKNRESSKRVSGATSASASASSSRARRLRLRLPTEADDRFLRAHLRHIRATTLWGPAVAAISTHLSFQVYLFWYVAMSWWARSYGLAALLTLVRRLSRDLPKRRVCGLRWYLVTFCFARFVVCLAAVAVGWWYHSLLEFAPDARSLPVFRFLFWLLNVEGSEAFLVSDNSVVSFSTDMGFSMALVAAAVAFIVIGSVNHSVGKEHREGYRYSAIKQIKLASPQAMLGRVMRTEKGDGRNDCSSLLLHYHDGPAFSRSLCLKIAILGTLRCLGMTLVGLAAVLSFVFGVHVVELLLLWAATFLACMWLPAAIDSCAVDAFALAGFVAFHLSRSYYRPWRTSYDIVHAFEAGTVVSSTLVAAAACYSALHTTTLFLNFTRKRSVTRIRHLTVVSRSQRIVERIVRRVGRLTGLGMYNGAASDAFHDSNYPSPNSPPGSHRNQRRPLFSSDYASTDITFGLPEKTYTAQLISVIAFVSALNIQLLTAALVQISAAMLCVICGGGNCKHCSEGNSRGDKGRARGIR